MLQMLKDFWPFIRLFRLQWPWVVLGAAFALLTLLMGLGLMGLVGYMVSLTLVSALALAPANRIFLSIFALGRTLSRYFERIYTHEAIFRLLADIRLFFFKSIIPLSPSQLSQYRSGDLLNRLVKEVDTLNNLYVRILLPLSVGLLVLLGLMVLLNFYVSPLGWILGGLTLLAGFVLPYVFFKLGQQIGAQQVMTSAQMRAHMLEEVQGLTEFTIYGQLAEHQSQLAAMEAQQMQQEAQMARYQSLSLALMGFLSLLTLVVLLYYFAHHTAEMEQHALIMLMAILGLGVVFEILGGLPSAFQYLGKTHQAAMRLRELLDAQPQVRFHDSSPRVSHTELFFDHVSFAYDEEKLWVLRNLNLCIPHQGSLAILGQTGAGKSTLLQLLSRFADPLEGEIRIGGIPLSQLDEGQVRELMAFVSQDEHIFNDTLANNLRLAKPHASDEELWRVLAIAQLDSWLKAQPEGLDLWLGDGGSRLSGGQVKRLLIARALLKDAPIFLLDEPTEGLDQKTEADLISALSFALSDKTLLVITHRPAALALAKTHLELVDGQLRPYS